MLRSPRDGKKPTASAVGLVFGEAEEVVGGAFEDLAEGFDIFRADGFRFVVDHAVEILIAQPHLYIQPIFCFAFFFKNIDNS